MMKREPTNRTTAAAGNYDEDGDDGKTRPSITSPGRRRRRRRIPFNRWTV